MIKHTPKRDAILEKLCVWADIKEGEIRPKWMLLVQAFLFPADALSWYLYETRHPYDPRTNTWTIAGIKYSAKALKRLADCDGETFKTTRIGETLTVEEVKNES